MNRNLKQFFLILFLGVIVVIIVIDYRVGLPLLITYTTAMLWQLYDKRKPHQVKFCKLHSCPSLAGQTAAMLLQEWPSPVGNHGNPEIHFVRTSSLYESSDKLPCHLVAVIETADGRNEVVGHAMISSNTDYHVEDRNKYINMIQKGVPLTSVKMSAKLAGIDSSFLDDPDIKNVLLKKDCVVQEACLTSLLVKPGYRGHGLGKGMCAYAITVSQELGIRRLVGGCADKLVPFYEKMGVCRMKGIRREDMPSVRLGNQMYLDLNPDVIQKAEKTASKSNYQFVTNS